MTTRTRIRRAANRDHRGVALYRLFDDVGCLLYVGISNAPEARFMEHAKDKTWWPDVASWQYEWLETRPLALRAETDAIWLEQPIYNRDRPFTRSENLWWHLANASPRLQRLERQCRSAAANGVRCIWPDVLYELLEMFRGQELEFARTRLEALLPETCACPDCWDPDRYGY